MTNNFSAWRMSWGDAGAGSDDTARWSPVIMREVLVDACRSDITMDETKIAANNIERLIRYWVFAFFSLLKITTMGLWNTHNRVHISVSTSNTTLPQLATCGLYEEDLLELCGKFSFQPADYTAVCATCKAKLVNHPRRSPGNYVLDGVM